MITLTKLNPNTPGQTKKMTGIFHYFLMGFIPIAMLIVLIAYAIYLVEYQNRVALKIEQNQSAINLQREAMLQDVNTVISDLLFLAAESELQEAFDDFNPEYLAQASSEMMNFSSAKKSYDQMRFIDKTGMEKIRINYDGSQAYIVPKNQLQSKRDRYYFIESLQLKMGEVYISPMDLNIEHGEIEYPHKPTLRVATPVVDNEGEFMGILIVNYLGQLMLDHFISIHADNPHLSHLVNSDGYWLHSYPHGLEWGFMFDDKKEQRFQADHARAWEIIKTKERGFIELDTGLYCFTSVDVSRTPLSDFDTPAQRQSAWKIISYNSRSELDLMLASTRDIIFLWSLISLLLVMVISWLLAGAIVNRKRAELIAQRAESRMKEAVRMALDSIITIDHEEYIVSFNVAAEKTFGVSSKEVIGKKLSETIMPERFREMHRKGMEHYLQSGEAPLLGKRLETMALHKDGHEFPIEVSITVIETDDHPQFTAFIRDARIALRQNDTFAEDTDVGFVPLAYLGGQARLSDKWRFLLDFEGLGASQGRAFDVAAKLGYAFSDRWEMAFGYRTIEGGADVEQVYNFAWLHFAVASIRVRF